MYQHFERAEGTQTNRSTSQGAYRMGRQLGACQNSSEDRCDATNKHKLKSKTNVHSNWSENTGIIHQLYDNL